MPVRIRPQRTRAASERIHGRKPRAAQQARAAQSSQRHYFFPPMTLERDARIVMEAERAMTSGSSHSVIFPSALTEYRHHSVTMGRSSRVRPKCNVFSSRTCTPICTQEITAMRHLP